MIPITSQWLRRPSLTPPMTPVSEPLPRVTKVKIYIKKMIISTSCFRTEYNPMLLTLVQYMKRSSFAVEPTVRDDSGEKMDSDHCDDLTGIWTELIFSIIHYKLVPFTHHYCLQMGYLPAKITSPRNLPTTPAAVRWSSTIPTTHSPTSQHLQSNRRQVRGQQTSILSHNRISL